MVEKPDPFQLKVKASTAVATALALGALLLFDWDKATGGHQTVFSGIRPAVKRVLNQVYGIEQPEVTQPRQQSDGGSSSGGEGR